MSNAITPYTISIPDDAVTALRDRLSNTRWPDAETGDGWTQGAPLAKVIELCRYWATDYDWRACERRLNGLPQFRTEIDDCNVHFFHLRSPEPDAMPLLITHGWPGTVVELTKVLEPLADPRKFGGDPALAFHVIAPSIPGYGFSDAPRRSDMDFIKVAGVWSDLMKRLGYSRYIAQGGDWGATIANAMGVMKALGLVGVHLNMLANAPPPDAEMNATDAELDVLRARAGYQAGSSYAFQQTTRPQTLAYGLADSPAFQAAWVFEKWFEWTDHSGDPFEALSMDDMLDVISTFWFTNSGGSSARLYAHSARLLGGDTVARGPMSLPVGVAVYPKEFFRLSRRWAEPHFSDIIHWAEHDRGGHHAAYEQPDRFVDDLRTFLAAWKARA